MSYTIEIQPAGVHFESESNLLSDALEQAVPLAYSCKTGECGTCEAEVVLGNVNNGYDEIVNRGVILTCQAKALSNVTLKAKYHPELASQKQQVLPCKVGTFSYVTNDIIVINFRFPPTAEFDFLPGQYIDLNFKGVKRSYSIANKKNDINEFELHIRKVPDGKMSNSIFGQIKEGQLMRIEGPKGTFFVRDNNKSLVFIATGTGIAPVKAMVEKLLESKDQRDIYIYWGMQYKEELYCSELIQYAKKHKQVTFFPVLSQEVNWEGHKGYVQDAVLKDFDSLAEQEVYACGSLNMINEARQLFINKKLPSESFYSDAFTAAK